MISAIRRDLDQGLRKLKWFATLFSDRLRIEITVLSLLYRSEELKKRKEELLRLIGEEVYEARGKEKNVYANREITAAIREIEKLEPEIKESVEKASEISKITV